MGNWNGKVLARFWCDKVEEIVYDYGGLYEMFQTSEIDCDNLNCKSCLTDNELKEYLKPKREHGNICGYAIHITNLEIFDEPKEISEISQWRDCGKCWHEEDCDCDLKNCFMTGGKLTKAPQSWQWIEI